MATVAQAVSRLSIEATTRGLDEATNKLNRMSDAQKGVTITGNQVTLSTGKTETAFNRLQRQYDATWRAQQELARVDRTLMAAQAQGLVTEQRRVELMTLAAERHGLAASAINRETIATNQLAVAQTKLMGANDNSQFRRQNLGYQAFDIGQGLAMGAPIGMIAAQQLPQIAQLYAAQGGLNALWKDAVGILGGIVRAAGPWIAAAGAIYGAYKLIASYGVEAQMAIDDTTAALAAQAAPLGSLRGQISELYNVQKTYTDAISLTAEKQTAATATIIANSEREFNAKKSLLELELKRQQAAITAQRAELDVSNHQLRRNVTAGDPGSWWNPFDGTNGVSTLMDTERRGFSDPRIGSVPFVRLPDDITGLRRTQELIDNDALSDKIKELRANLELTEIGAKALQDALTTTFDSTTVNAAKAGKAVKDAFKPDRDGFAEMLGYTKEYIAQLDAANERAQYFGDLGMTFFRGLTQGADGFNDSLNRITQSLLDAALQATLLGQGPLASLFGTATKGGDVGGLLGAAFSLFSAKGHAFDGGNVVPFARGGIVDQPTVFPFAKGIGLMGEAGPEAIMPLHRDSFGRLGVSASNQNGGKIIVQNIINNAPARTQTRTEQQQTPDGTLIRVVTDIVDQHIATGGADKSFGTRYGARVVKSRR